MLTIPISAMKRFYNSRYFWTALLITLSITCGVATMFFSGPIVIGLLAINLAITAFRFSRNDVTGTKLRYVGLFLLGLSMISVFIPGGAALDITLPELLESIIFGATAIAGCFFAFDFGAKIKSLYQNAALSMDFGKKIITELFYSTVKALFAGVTMAIIAIFVPSIMIITTTPTTTIAQYALYSLNVAVEYFLLSFLAGIVTNTVAGYLSNNMNTMLIATISGMKRFYNSQYFWPALLTTLSITCGVTMMFFFGPIAMGLLAINLAITAFRFSRNDVTGTKLRYVGFFLLAASMISVFIPSVGAMGIILPEFLESIIFGTTAIAGCFFAFDFGVKIKSLYQNAALSMGFAKEIITELLSSAVKALFAGVMMAIIATLVPSIMAITTTPTTTIAQYALYSLETAVEYFLLSSLAGIVTNTVAGYLSNKMNTTEKASTVAKSESDGSATAPSITQRLTQCVGSGVSFIAGYIVPSCCCSSTDEKAEDNTL